MDKTGFDPARALGAQIASMDRQELLSFVIDLCRTVLDSVGPRRYCGGIYPENISRNEDGSLAVGEGTMSGWKGQELDFVAPELYWNGQCSPASDVFSIGMLLCYGVSGGKLPYEGTSPNPQLSRMSGKIIPVPKGAPGLLGEIIAKAISFDASRRYQSVEELEINLENCLDNKYLGGESESRAIFQKEEEELSDIERMMVGILQGGAEPAEPAREPEPESAEPSGELSVEETIEQILADSAPEKRPEEKEDPLALMKEYFSEEESGEAGPDAGETEDVRLYEPGRREKTDGQVIPVLTEEMNPELAPVVPQPTKSIGVEYSGGKHRKKDGKKRKRRPLLAVLCLCALLIAAALIGNWILTNYTWEGDTRVPRDAATPIVGENAPQLGENGTGSIVTPKPDPAIPQQQVYYQVFRDDCNWIDAKAKAEELGGHLVVITSQEELLRVAEAVGGAGIPRAWIGLHRVDGRLEWETSEYVGFYMWDEGEPSGVDSYDNAPEDFVMLVNNGRWVYNDCRNDPAAEFPDWYSGAMGYVVEFGVGE